MECELDLLSNNLQYSKEPLRFLEIHYRGADESQKPIGLVGKGKKWTMDVHRWRYSIKCLIFRCHFWLVSEDLLKTYLSLKN